MLAPVCGDDAMTWARITAGIGFAAVALSAAALPALGASDVASSAVAARRALTPVRSGIGTFTPAAADPKLAAVLARGGLPSGSFRFTPTEASRKGSRAVTVAVRARSSQSAEQAGRAAVASNTATTASVGIAPIAYNLGVAVGWRRFALSTDVSRVDLAGRPGSREAASVGVSYTGRRASGQVRAAADRPLAGASALVEDPSVSLDVGGSYRLTRNLDVTAGVRYKSERERLERLEDNRRDSQAVYVGTAFRF